jgi:hypothetical protein
VIGGPAAQTDLIYGGRYRRRQLSPQERTFFLAFFENIPWFQDQIK